MRDLLRVSRAIATNQIARLLPAAYLRLTQQTGRGAGDAETPEGIARYFHQCVDDYLAFAGIAPAQRDSHFQGKAIVEYGPGDFPGVALVLLALGARKVWCVDRFPMVRLSEKNLLVLDALLRDMPPAQRERVLGQLRNRAAPAEGFRDEAVEYVVRPHGFSGLDGVADLVISRAVLEHVDDLDGSFADMLKAMRPGAWAWHQVDLKSHGLHRENALDFLEWSPALWSAMYSQKGVPNRWRVDRYRAILARLPVTDLHFEPTRLADPADVAAVRDRVSAPFRGISAEDLSWLGFWVRFRKPMQ